MWRRLFLLMALSSALVLVAAGANAQVEEEDLADVGLEALPPSLPPIDDAEIRTLFDEAEGLFNSTDQDASLPLFGQIVELLGPQHDAGQLSEESLGLLIRSLAYRARLHFNYEETELVDSGLRRMLEIQPQADLDRTQASPKLVDQFDALRRRIVGEIDFVLEPADAEVRIDGHRVDSLAGPVAALAGPRQIDVTLPGYLPINRPMEIESDTLITIELTLERTSAVIRLNTRPAGAAVSVGGVARGVTEGIAPEGFLPQGPAAVYRREEFSAELVIEGIQPGLVNLEVTKDGYRSQRFELPIYELLDYPMPPIVLEEESGSLVFNDFPTGAVIRIDGTPRRPDNPGSSRPRLKLPPGTYHVTVASGSSKMFSTQLRLADGQTSEINVRLRPGLAYLGVLGGDEATARDLDQSLRLALADSGKWTLINHSARAPEVLREVGVTADSLRSVEADAAGGARSAIDWKKVQSAVDADVAGLVYAVAVPSTDLLPTHASIWIWPRSPGPASPNRVRLPLGDPEALAALNASFNRTIGLRRAWVGALLIDTNGAPHPLVVDVTPASPAEAAGLAVGDLVVGVAGVPVTTGAAFAERIAAAEIGETLDLAVQSSSGPRQAKLKVGASPDVLASSRADLLDSVAFTELVLLAETAPRELAWVVELDQVMVLMRAREWAEAARRLGAIRAPQTSHGVGQATVDYLLGVALAAAGPEYLEAARKSFEKAAQVEGARLFHHDGPWVAPRARARLVTLGR
ncbi:MAG: PDZ domain-containing protein [bacterium]|nr:PDZ domain-containing protein [bacterium]